MQLRRRISLPRVGNPNNVRDSSNGLRSSMTAAGMRVGRTNSGIVQRVQMPWQSRSFAYYDLLGEIKYAASFYSRGLSQLTLYAGVLQDDGKIEPSTDPAAIETLKRVQDPGGGRTGLLSSYGRLMFLAGECYLFVSNDPETDLEQWEILSTDELRPNGSTYQRFRAPSLQSESYISTDKNVDGEWTNVEGDQAVAYRLWKKHPRYSMWADATMQGVLDLCEELVLLTQAVRARTRSRLAGSGILLIDERMSPASPHTIGDEDPEEDILLSDITEAMTAPIADESSASAIVPLTIRVPVPDGMKVGDMLYHLQIIDPMQLYPETGLRYECIKRIAIGLDMPPEILMGLQDSNHWCQSHDTEIMCRGRGWITHDMLAIGDEVYTLNHDTGDGEWNAVTDIYRATVAGEAMYAMDSESHSSLSTPGHRWPIIKTGYKVAGSRRRWTTSADGFTTTDRVPVAATLANDSTTPVVSDDFVRLLVAFTADGTVLDHDNIRIVKFSDREIEEMRRILVSTFGADGFREHRHPTRDRDGVAFVLRQDEARELLAHCGQAKAIHLSFVDDLTTAQRDIMLASCVEIGDGVNADDTSATLYQVDPSRLDAFAYAAHLSGCKVTYGKRNQQTGFGTEPLPWIRWSRSRTTFRPSHCDETLTAYTGTVWCPVTANATWMARRDGKVYFTGNTAWQIDESTWKGHLQPVAQQFVDDLTSTYYRPTLRALGVADWDRQVIAFDATAIINHPDRTRDAKDLYDRRAIGKAAVRAAAGFSDTDAPTEEELAEMIGIAVRDGSLAMTGEPRAADSPGGPSGGGVPSPDAPGGGAEGENLPPEQPVNAPQPAVTGSAQTAMTVARILGAADLAVLRARESAGNRVRNLAKRNPEANAKIDGVRASEVIATLGPETLSVLKAGSERNLVTGCHDLIVDTLRLWGIVDDELVAFMVEQVEAHAARTLYHQHATPLPQSVRNYIEGFASGATFKRGS